MKTQTTKKSESERFVKFTDDLLKVPHSEIKAKLEEEKLIKKEKKAKKHDAK
jgi:hypothetical protein